jgi:hypothetical protein
MIMDNSHITVTKNGGMCFAGPDATRLYAAMQIKSFIGLYQKCGMIPTRGMTITRMLEAATRYTGQTYKRGQASKAMDDLTIWIETMKSALPVEVLD